MLNHENEHEKARKTLASFPVSNLALFGPFHLISTPPCRRRLPRGSWFFILPRGGQKICISKFLKVLQTRHVDDVLRGGNIDFLFFWGGNCISKFPKGFANLACGPRLPTKGVLIFNFSEGGGGKKFAFLSSLKGFANQGNFGANWNCRA